MIRERKTTISYPEQIEQYLTQESNPEIRMRLVLLNLIAKLDRDYGLKDICDLLKVPLSTAYVWIRSWEEFGYEGIASPYRTSERPPGRPPTLDETDMGTLKILLGQKDHWETHEVRELITRIWGVTLSPSQVWRILKDKLRMHFSKPCPQDFRRPPDAEEQLEEALIKTYISLMEKGYSADQIALGFIDEASPQTTANTVRFWQFGHAPIIKNTTKFKANTIGFYAIHGHSVSDFIPDASQESIETFLSKVREANSNYQAVVVILDRFSSHRSDVVVSAANASGIALVHLPPYSPDLNPIEFIWKTIKRAVSKSFIHSLSDMRHVITNTWGEAVKSQSYAKNWIETFVPNIIT